MGAMRRPMTGPPILSLSDLTLTQGFPRLLFLFLVIHHPSPDRSSLRAQTVNVSPNKKHGKIFFHPAWMTCWGGGFKTRKSRSEGFPTTSLPARGISIDYRRTRDLEILSQSDSRKTRLGTLPRSFVHPTHVPNMIYPPFPSR